MGGSLTIAGGTQTLQRQQHLYRRYGRGGGTPNLTGSIIGSLGIFPGATFTTTGGYGVAPNAFLSNAGTFQSLGGAPLINRGALINNGQLDSNLFTAGLLGGSGTINGNVVNTGVLGPGNSIGTLTVNGNYTQAAGSSYLAEVNAAGQSDRLTVTGTATLQGGSVAALPQAPESMRRAPTTRCSRPMAA